MSQETIPQHFRQRIKEAREQQLSELDLSYERYIGQKLTKIPACIFEYTHLKKLNLRYNDIEEIPSEIAKLTNLESLDLSSNQLDTLPEAIGNLTNLTELYLSSNQLDTLPESVGNLTNLTELYLNSNQLDTLPESVGNLTNLTELNLNSNQLKTLPESVGNLANLTELNLSRNQLKTLPESVVNLTNLTELNLNSNQLDTLPESVVNLTNLTQLDLISNQLKTLPESVVNLANLTQLDLSRNQLKTLPESVVNLANLTQLNLISNRLETLPESVGNLTNLTQLDLSYNQLKTLPESIVNIANLTQLDLSYNRLETLPESVGNLTNLTQLDLSRNRLKTLPEAIGNLTNLTQLNLSYNPLEKPPIEVANQGIDAIRAYFRQLSEEGKEYIYEAKLLIVGEGGAGKTTLAKKIEDFNYELDSNEKSTEGIDITKWSFFLDNGQEFRVNIWDFGGQEIYHATHQFFLTKRSLYALVADTRKEDTDFYYWLNVVELLSNNSPLLIVKNEKGDRYIEIDLNTLRGRFENLKESLATNLKDNRGLNAILDSLQYHFKQLPHIGSALPKTWKRVRETLEEDGRNYISLEEYLQICSKNGFKQLKDKLQLSGYLHDLGVCLHFQDSPLLKNTVILKPEWGTDGVYKVLENKEVINNRGRFTTNDLENIWSDEQYQFKQAELLELMMRFKLCYQIPGIKDTYIAPQLLTKTQPDYDWDETDNLILRYTYQFMPKGIITQLIVLLHQYIYQQEYVWRSGVYFKKGDTLANVIEYYDTREIQIRVFGKQKKDLLTIITHELDKIHSSYPRLKYQKLIPCNCNTCKRIQNPYAYQFNELVERLTNNKLTIECGKPPYNEVQVFSLIDNAIDIKQLIYQETKDSNKSLEFKGNIAQLIIQYLEKGDIMAGSRNIKQNHSGSADNVAGDKNINQSGGLTISGNAQVTASGAGAFSQSDNQGTIANEINENNSPPQQESKLFQRLAIASTLTATLAAIIALFFNGIFNDEVKQWFDNLFDKDTPSLSEPAKKN